MTISIVSTSDRPELVPVVARWVWDAFGRGSGQSLEQACDAVTESVAGRPMPRTFVLIIDGEPCGTASLVAHDLDERPDLTPWLASVFVVPHARGQGHAKRLITAVEEASRAASISTLWLFTNTAERIYARAGWQTTETILHRGKQFALMKRDLCQPWAADEARSCSSP